jgi:hypothetical protein
MNHFRTHPRGYDWIAIFIAITLVVGLISPVSAAPLHQDMYTDNGIDMNLFETDSRTYCPGDEIKFRAQAGSDFRGFPMYTTGIQIKVNGVVKATTEKARAYWTESAPKTPGLVKLTATAEFPGGAAAGWSATRHYSYTVMECAYDFQIQYDETYSEPMGGGTFTEIATVTVKDAFSISPDGTLKPKSGGQLTANYVMKGTFSIGGKVVACTPNTKVPLGGTFGIDASGKREKDGSATLQLTQVSLLGGSVDWSCVDLSGRHPYYQSMMMLNMSLIARAKLDELSFKRNEGRKPITVPGGGVFWAIKDSDRKGWVALTLVQTEPKSDWFDW